MNLDEHLVVPDGRPLHFSDPNDVRWAVSGLDRRLHTGTVAAGPVYAQAKPMVTTVEVGTATAGVGRGRPEDRAA